MSCLRVHWISSKNNKVIYGTDLIAKSKLLCSIVRRKSGCVYSQTEEQA
jgi:hypothetical protein